MKDGIHPENYRLVVFKDMSNEYAFLGKSTINTKETIQWEDGNEYPVVKPLGVLTNTTADSLNLKNKFSFCKVLRGSMPLFLLIPWVV